MCHNHSATPLRIQTERGDLDALRTPRAIIYSAYSPGPLTPDRHAKSCCDHYPDTNELSWLLTHIRRHIGSVITLWRGAAAVE